jgi:hypothetical protein
MRYLCYPVAAMLVASCSASSVTSKPTSTSASSLEPKPVPAELVPAGFSADECWIEETAKPLTESPPGGSAPIATGTRSPLVRCKKKTGEKLYTKSQPVCHTKGGKPLPLGDCCVAEDGTAIAGCTPKLVPEGQ